MSFSRTAYALPTQISEHLFRIEDTCSVYALVNGTSATLVDFGSGLALDGLAQLGVTQVTDVLMTHHHRDQGQGLSLAAAAGARIWVPHAEQDLFADLDAYWQARELYNNYNVRQDRFSLLASVPLAGTLKDYDHLVFGGYPCTIVPTPGHTPGSITILVEIDGQQVAFCGDLIATSGKLWSLAATQWTYNGGEGIAASLASLYDLKRRQANLLLPAHGEPMQNPAQAIDKLSEKLYALLQVRGEYTWLPAAVQQPYEVVTPHVLVNRTSNACSYVLRSDNGQALFFDFGYDFDTGLPAGFDRASRRPWLFSLDALKSGFNIHHVEVAIPTHYHDDHVAGLTTLRRVEGTEVWAASQVSAPLENPSCYDLPCLWYDPVPVDRILPMNEPIAWHEYEITLYPLPGHTRHAVAIFFQADEKRFLVIGDQYQFGLPPMLNYVYPNRFEASDYVASAELLRQLKPDVLLTGHWGEQLCGEDFLQEVEQRGKALQELQCDIILSDGQGMDASGAIAHIQPYQAKVQAGEAYQFEVEAWNPTRISQDAFLTLIVPQGWQTEPKELKVWLETGRSNRSVFSVTPPGGVDCRRARIAVDVVIGEHRFGQVAEALIDVLSVDIRGEHPRD